MKVEYLTNIEKNPLAFSWKINLTNEREQDIADFI